MEDIDIYADVCNIDLGSEIYKLEGENKQLLDHIRKLESDIEKLCSRLVDMKQVQQNLSRNISELFKTAKLEIDRKDRTIADLRKEVDDLTINKGNKRKLKRQRNGNTVNLPAKRLRTNLNVVNVRREIESAFNSQLKVDEKVKLESSNNKDLEIINREDKSNINYNEQDSYPKTNLHELDSINNERKEDAIVDKGKHNDEFSIRQKTNDRWRGRSGDRNRRRQRSRTNDRSRRSRSNDRSRRSRSNERFNNRNKNNARFGRSTSIERNKFIENIARRSHSRSKDRNFSRSKSKDSRHESYNGRYGRSRSIERNKFIENTTRSSHSRSKDRNFSRSKSKDSRHESYNGRYGRSRSIERNKFIENTTRSSHSRSKDRNFSRSKSKDSRHETYNYRNRSRNRHEIRKSPSKVKNNPKNEQLINEPERDTGLQTPEPRESDFIVIDDLEEGEIAPSPVSNKFNNVKKQTENQQNCNSEKNCASLPKAEMKTITIVEYRNRQKTVITEACIIEEKSKTENEYNTSETTVENANVPLEDNIDQVSVIKEHTNANSEKSRIERETENNKKLETKLKIENPANALKTSTANVLNKSESCSNISKNQEEPFTNNSLNASNLEISSISNDSGVSTNPNNSLNSSGGRNRRRRCVVIGYQ